MCVHAACNAVSSPLLCIAARQTLPLYVVFIDSTRLKPPAKGLWTKMLAPSPKYNAMSTARIRTWQQHIRPQTMMNKERRWPQNTGFCLDPQIANISGILTHGVAMIIHTYQFFANCVRMILTTELGSTQMASLRILLNGNEKVWRQKNSNRYNGLGIQPTISAQKISCKNHY